MFERSPGEEEWMLEPRDLTKLREPSSCARIQTDSPTGERVLYISLVTAELLSERDAGAAPSREEIEEERLSAGTLKGPLGPLFVREFKLDRFFW